MKALHSLALLFALAATATLWVGCGHKEGDGHEHEKTETHSESDGHGHGHGEQSATGASFKAGKGVMISDEIRKNLGVEVLDVEERKLSTQIPFTIQVF